VQGLKPNKKKVQGPIPKYGESAGINDTLKPKKYINFKVWGHFAHKCKTSGGYLQNVMFTNRRI